MVVITFGPFNREKSIGSSPADLPFEPFDGFETGVFFLLRSAEEDKPTISPRPRPCPRLPAGLTQGLVRAQRDDSDRLGLVDPSQPQLLQTTNVAPEASLVVPPHRTDVGLLELVGLAGRMPPEKVEQGLERHELVTLERREGRVNREREGLEQLDEVVEDLLSCLWVEWRQRTGSVSWTTGDFERGGD